MTNLSESEVEKLQRQFTANKIDDRIWLGDISSAQDIQALDLLKITHVLSVMNFQPIGFVDDRRSRKHIHAYDSPSANLIDHFDEAFAFIDKALAEGSNVLIHCLAGSTSPKRVSRSATIACAYLMRKYQWSDEEALAKIQEKRLFACPNDGFRRQLRLFYKNQWKLPEVEEKRDQPVTITRLPGDSTSVEYKCKICRETLFGQIDLVRHPIGKGRFDVHARSSSYKARQNAEFQDRPNCDQELFTDQPSWLMDIYNKPINDGDILCPNSKCRAKVGRYSLIGEKCSCAVWVNPAFHFHRTKVDLYTPLNNLDAILTKRID